MRRVFLVYIWVLALLASPLTAQNLALVIGDKGSNFPSFAAASRAVTPSYEVALQAAGFEIISAQNRSSRSVYAAMVAAEAQLKAGQVDHLVVLVSGPFVHSARQTWVLTNDIEQTNLASVFARGIDLQRIADLTALAKGNAALILGTGYRQPDPSAPLVLGPSEPRLPKKALMIRGGVKAIRPLIERGLLDPKRPMGKLRQLVGDAKISIDGEYPKDTPFLQSGRKSATDTGALAQATEEGYWAAVRDIGTREAYIAYLRAYPRGKFEEEALEAIAGGSKPAPGPSPAEIEEGLKLTKAQRMAIQYDLTVLGYNLGEIDGVFGKGTRKEIRRWQQKSKIQKTGYLDGEQIARIRSEAAALGGASFADFERDKADEARLLDRQLARLLAEQQLEKLRLAPGRVDGAFDARTRTAIRRFQELQGLPATGFFGQSTLVKLMGGR